MDLNPDSILVSEDGTTIKISDFGMAQSVSFSTYLFKTFYKRD
jgi:serine/threonine protein kinase